MNKEKKINWKKVKPGTWFSAQINYNSVIGKIQIQDGVIFLCQDKESGNYCKNKLGFEFSWELSHVNNMNYNLSEDDVYSLVLHEKKPKYSEVTLRKIELNGSYSALIIPGGVKVGCQTFTNDVIRKVAENLID